MQRHIIFATAPADDKSAKAGNECPDLASS